MNVFRKIHDRLNGVLGYDRRGKRIRAGDRVMLVGDEIRPELRGLVGKVESKSKAGGVATSKLWGSDSWVRVRLDGRPRPGRCQCHDLIRLDEGDDADWRRVSESTGWTPRTVTEPGKVPV